MIAYPGPALALQRTSGDRSAARHLIRAHIMAAAEEQAATAGCSFNCMGDRHVDEVGGCKNDGSGCICSCHDAKAVKS